MRRFRLALSFLTVLPVRISGEFHPGDLGRAAGWFPWVGLLLGVILEAGKGLLDRFFPSLLAAAILTALWAGLTGGLHLDGLADCCDGLLAAVTPARRLEIMHDPRLGTFGGVGLILHILLKTLALAALAPVVLERGTTLPSQAATGLLPGPLAALLLAPTLSRWLLLPLGSQGMARPGGLGAEFSLGLKRSNIWLAALLPLALALLGGLRGLLAAALACLAAAGVARLARVRLGGLTGDILGLVVELAEMIVLLVFATH
jgi:adenosylcobinamide-GDP ribazoletransferase